MYSLCFGKLFVLLLFAYIKVSYALSMAYTIPLLSNFHQIINLPLLSK